MRARRTAARDGPVPGSAVELTTGCEGTESAGFTDTEGTTFEFEIEPSDQGFEDIGSLPEEFRDAINVPAELGVVEGKSPGRYAPSQSGAGTSATGAIFVQTGEDPNGFTTDDAYFPDVDGDVHEDNINGIASVGIVQGRNDGRYTRAIRSTAVRCRRSSCAGSRCSTPVLGRRL